MVEQLEKDMITAMKDKDKEKLTVIRMVKASLKQEQIDHKKEINDELLIDVVNKQIKMRKDSIAEFEKGNRTDLIEKTQFEIDVLMNYLPEQLSTEEVIKIIEEIFEEVKPESQKDMGKIMGPAQAKLKGKADMKEVSNIIREKLNNDSEFMNISNLVYYHKKIKQIISLEEILGLDILAIKSVY